MVVVNIPVKLEVDEEPGNLKLPWYLYLRPIMCTFGVITNVINIIIFHYSPKLKHSTYRLMLVISVVDFFYLLFFLISSFISDCKQYCTHMSSMRYEVKLFDLYIEDYLSSCLALFVIFIEIILSFKRYLILSNSRRFQNEFVNKLTVAIAFIVSLIYYIPVLYVKEIVEYQWDNSTSKNTKAPTLKKYELVKSDFGKTPFGKALPITLGSIRLLLATFLLSFINILTSIRFKFRLKNKVKVKSFPCDRTCKRISL